MKLLARWRLVRRRLRKWLFLPAGYVPTEDEEAEDVLITAWGITAVLLMPLVVISLFITIDPVVTWAIRAFAEWDVLYRCLVVGSIPFTMVWWKKRSPVSYGVAEIVIGGLVLMSAAVEMSAERTTTFAKFLAAFYGTSRGVQNLTDGLVKRRKESAARRMAATVGTGEVRTA